MGYGYSEDAVDCAADWLVLTTEDEPWLAGRDCTALCLDFFWGGSPLAAIATALAEGLCRQFECFSGISSMQKNSEKKTTLNTTESNILRVKIKRLTPPVMGKP